MGFSWKLAVLLLPISAGGAFVQRVTGFGFGIFVMLFLPHLTGSSPKAAAISGMISIVGTVYNAVRHRKDIRWKTILPLIIAALVTIPIAVQLSAYAPERLLKTILGVVLILLSIYFLAFSKKIRLKPTVAGAAVTGCAGGVLTGMFSTGGPPVVLYLTSALPDKATYFASIQTYFCATNLYSTGVRALNGIITTEILIYSAIGVASFFVGDAVGAKIFDRLDAEKFRRIIYIGMIVSGVLMIV